MKLFLSWSGERSRQMAESLRRLFPLIVQDLDVFLSAHDIESGARWARELANSLDQSSFGILCLTPDNLDSKWLYFEAGALTKHSEGRACCLLIGGLESPDVPLPLSQFQNRRFDKSGVHSLLRDLNGRVEKPLAAGALDKLFEKFWPDLEIDYDEAITKTNGGFVGYTPRLDRDILEEILLHVRSLGALSNRSPIEPLPSASDILSRPINHDSLAWYTLWKFPGLEVSDRVHQILLRDPVPVVSLPLEILIELSIEHGTRWTHTPLKIPNGLSMEQIVSQSLWVSLTKTFERDTALPSGLGRLSRSISILYGPMRSSV
jgi:hypothetical protein